MILRVMRVDRPTENLVRRCLLAVDLVFNSNALKGSGQESSLEPLPP